jgi:hypothetical protein
MPLLSPESVVVRNERLAWRVLDGEAVILFPEEGTLHRLNATGTRAWEQFDGRPLSAVTRALTSEYRVDHDEAMQSIEGLVGDLLEMGLVEVRS